MMKLYSFFNSSASYRVRIALALKASITRAWASISASVSRTRWSTGG
jgi:glutathione S-transferase